MAWKVNLLHFKLTFLAFRFLIVSGFGFGFDFVFAKNFLIKMTKKTVGQYEVRCVVDLNESYFTNWMSCWLAGAFFLERIN